MAVIYRMDANSHDRNFTDGCFSCKERNDFDFTSAMNDQRSNTAHPACPDRREDKTSD